MSAQINVQGWTELTPRAGLCCTAKVVTPSSDSRKRSSRRRMTAAYLLGTGSPGCGPAAMTGHSHSAESTILSALAGTFNRRTRARSWTLVDTRGLKTLAPAGRPCLRQIPCSFTQRLKPRTSAQGMNGMILRRPSSSPTRGYPFHCRSTSLTHDDCIFSILHSPTASNRPWSLSASTARKSTWEGAYGLPASLSSSHHRRRAPCRTLGAGALMKVNRHRFAVPSCRSPYQHPS